MKVCEGLGESMKNTPFNDKVQQLLKEYTSHVGYQKARFYVNKGEWQNALTSLLKVTVR
jgi:hypothetical protein